MKTVQRGNKQLRVDDDRLDEMLKAGYVEVDGETGKPLNIPGAENAATAVKNKELKANAGR